MNFCNNLQKLRKEKNYSQEQLAEHLYVSRQAVSKWESGAAYPEIDKLIALCDLFECTMDHLVKGEVIETKSHMTREYYDRFSNRFSFMIATGVFIILLGIIAFLGLDDMFPKNEYIPSSAFLFCVFVAVIIFVYYGLQKEEFNLEVDFEKNPYPIKSRKQFQQKFVIAITAGVGFILFGIIMQIALSATTTSNIPNMVFMLFVAVAVFLFVYYGMQKEKYNMTECKTIKPDEYKVKKDSKDALVGKISSVIMLLAAAIYLVFGLGFHIWTPSWVVFPIGGILCGIAAIIVGEDK